MIDRFGFLQFEFGMDSVRNVFGDTTNGNLHTLVIGDRPKTALQVANGSVGLDDSEIFLKPFCRRTFDQQLVQLTLVLLVDRFEP